MRHRRNRHATVDRHHLTLAGGRFVTAACLCGWVSEGHRSRGQATQAWEGHVYLATGRLQSFGVDARRREP